MPCAFSSHMFGAFHSLLGHVAVGDSDCDSVTGHRYLVRVLCCDLGDGFALVSMAAAC